MTRYNRIVSYDKGKIGKVALVDETTSEGQIPKKLDQDLEAQIKLEEARRDRLREERLNRESEARLRDEALRSEVQREEAARRWEEKRQRNEWRHEEKRERDAKRWENKKARQEQRKENREERKERNRETADKIKRLPRKAKIIGAIVAVLAFIVVITVVLPMQLNKHEVTYVSSAELEKVVNVSELSMVESTYEGIAEIDRSAEFFGNEYVNWVELRIRYKAQVRTIFDMSAIQFEVDNENKTITAILPPPENGEPILDEDRFSFLPEGKQIPLSEVIAACKEDASREINANKEIKKRAYENIESIVRALTLPLIPKGYELKFEKVTDKVLERIHIPSTTVASDGQGGADDE